MNFDQLRYFKTVAEEENLGRASQRLHITQQGLSANIIKLEGELGAYLFDRVGRQIYLNDTGRTFLAHVDNLLNEIKAAEDELKQHKVERRKTISVSTTGNVIASKVINGFLSCHSDVNIELNVIDDKYIPFALSQQNANFVISSVLYSGASTETAFLYEQSFLVAVAGEHPFSELSGIYLNELKEEKFALYPETSTFRRDLNTIFEKAGISPVVVLSSNSTEAIIDCVQSGTAITILGKHGERESGLWASRNIKLIPVLDDFAKRNIYIHWKKSVERSPHYKQFLEYSIENAQAILENPMV